MSWSRTDYGRYRADLQIDADDRHGLLHDVTAILANEKTSVAQLDSQIDDATQQARISLGVFIESQTSLQRIIARLLQVKGIHKVERSGNN